MRINVENSRMNGSGDHIAAAKRMREETAGLQTGVVYNRSNHDGQELLGYEYKIEANYEKLQALECFFFVALKLFDH